MRLLLLCLPLFTYSSLRGLEDEVTSTTLSPDEVDELLSDVVISSEDPESPSGRKSSFLTNDGERIAFRSWEPSLLSPKAVVYIVHGMAEHSGRYSAFAEQLVDELCVQVIAPDQRGHGLTSTHMGTADHKLGEFRKGQNPSQSNAISLMGSDINELISATHQGLPVIVFGHSMGSVVARTALQLADKRMGEYIKGLILSGVPTAPHWLELYSLNAIANLVLTTGVGHEVAQRTVTHYKFDEPVRLKAKSKDLPVNCFVSSDLEECRIFNADPYTNHLVDAEILLSIVTTLSQLEKATYFGPTSVDVLFVTGREDPVASFGATAREDAERMIKAGHHVTELYLSHSRHEFLREKAATRKEGIAQVVAWMRTKLDL